MSFKKYTRAEQAILTTILYSDIFSFPLTKDELWKFLISEKKISHGEFAKSLDSLKKVISFQKGYYCLSGKEAIIGKRIHNAPEVARKMSLARSTAEKLSGIPSILFIGISGGLAVGNVNKNDDIDLVIITKKDLLFVSRLLVLSVLESMGVRRSRKQKNTANTICVNLLFDETVLGWFGRQQDVYTAREITQMMPLFERNAIYQKFLDANKWVEHYLPNVRNARSEVPKIVSREQPGKLFEKLVLNILFESLTRFLQMSIMKRHHSIETLSKHLLAFHPNDYRFKTLRQLRLKKRNLGLLTKI